MCKLCNWQGLNFQNTQTAHTTQYQKTKRPNQKMGRRPKQTFLQWRHTDGQQIKEMMLKIVNYQRNTNQNYSEVLPHTSQNGWQKGYK